MAWSIHNAHFHLAMYASYLGWRPAVTTVSEHSLVDQEIAREKLHIHFWVPSPTAGSMVIVDNVLPCLREEAVRLGCDWTVTEGSELPDREVDWLICFKATPTAADVVGRPRRVLLICDQAEVHWKNVPAFDEVVATSSEPFAWLLAWRHPRVFLISESEPESHLQFGRANLADSELAGRRHLLWHGGAYSLGALRALRPILESWAAHRDAGLDIVCGREPRREEHWGRLLVRFFPWSEDQLRACAADARLGIVPAKPSLKLSWLKPASRIRCLYALGVPAIGDRRVPDVAQFLEGFNGPIAAGDRDWGTQLEYFWDHPIELHRLAAAGLEAVATHATTRVTARRWIRYLSLRRSAKASR